MSVVAVIPQLRTTDLRRSIEFYTTELGFRVYYGEQR